MAEKPVILIVDDAASNLQLLAQLLKDDYRIKVANNGPKALELAQTGPDLILLDIVMPDMDGYEVCKQLKNNEKTNSISVIFITGKTGADDEERGLMLGAVDFITKPIRPAIVMARVKTHITIIQQHQQLQQLATRDQLTKIFNRRYLLDVAAQKMARAKRHGNALSMIMLDVDHFKAINDQHGHAVGDVVLREIAAILDSSCRAEDVAARMGGEEFVLLLDCCNISDCQNKAERLRQQIEQLMPQTILVTASFGIAEYSPEDNDFESFFNRVDKALYTAKNNGRNQVVVGSLAL